MTSPSPRARTGEPADTSLPLVLIVDDNEKNLKLARDVLRAAGLRTLEAASGAEAIALAAEQLPDVILLDLRLPDMDGIDVARELQERGANGADPGRRAERSAGSRTTATGCSPPGFAGYLEKPISVGEFPDQVRGYCGARDAGVSALPRRCARSAAGRRRHRRSTRRAARRSRANPLGMCPARERMPPGVSVASSVGAPFASAPTARAQRTAIGSASRRLALGGAVLIAAVLAAARARTTARPRRTSRASA